MRPKLPRFASPRTATACADDEDVAVAAEAVALRSETEERAACSDAVAMAAAACGRIGVECELRRRERVLGQVKASKARALGERG